MRVHSVKYFLLALLTLGVGMVGCRRGGDESKSPANPTQAAAKETPIQVSVTPARYQPLTEAIEVTGALNALQDVTVGAKSGGRLAAVYFREGDLVRKGQVVAQQDIADLQAQVDQAQAQRGQAQAQRGQAQANLTLAQSKLEQARVAHKNAQTTQKWTDDQTRTAVGQAQAALEAAKQQAAIVEEGARPQERQQAEENVTAAKADRDKARADLKRYQDLYRQQAISAQQLDQVQAIADSADARYNSAVAALNLVKEGARQEERLRARALVEQATQTLATAQSNRDQVKLRGADVETARAGVLSALAGVQQAKAALRQSEAALQQSDAAVRLVKQALGDASIRSPIDGVVAERKAEPGVQLTTVSGDAMRIIALDSIYYDAQLSETQYARVQAGQPVTVRVDALPGKTFPGRVAKIFPIASATARTFTIRIALQNKGNILRPQMFARGEITLATRPRALVVQREALLDYDTKSGRLFVVDNGKAKERKVTTGFSNLRVVEVTSNLREGDKVITIGQAGLQDGDRVTLVPNGNGVQQAKQVSER